MLNKATAVGLSLGVALLLSSCSNAGATPTDFRTPSAPASSNSADTGSSTSDGSGQEQFSDGLQVGTNAFGKPVDNVSAPFGLDNSGVVINEQVKEAYGDEESQRVVTSAMQFIQDTTSVDTRWKNSAPSIDDYRVAENYITPEAWTRLSEAVSAGDPDGLASSLLPGKLPDNKLGDKDVPEGLIPRTLAPQNVTMELAQDETRFGDPVARVKINADVYSQFILEDGTSFYGVRKVTLYMISLGDGWKVDYWDTNTMKEA